MFVVDDRIGIRFKKHGSDGLTHSIHTRHQRWLLTQRPIEGLPASITHLACGYVLDRAGAEIHRIVISKPIGLHQSEWEIDVRELAAGEAEPYAEPLPIQLAAPAAGLPTLRPASREAEGDSEDS